MHVGQPLREDVQGRSVSGAPRASAYGLDFTDSQAARRASSLARRARACSSSPPMAWSR
ncbi:hypothetical protein [Streptomyces subrutilus]|uniref:hypothetical protein n=1 Tax=Streptomyces subrutilus TaxID=36818 RepID=UPI0016794D66|nr:hypothetical protein [Streptomyces subrutilus]